MNRVIKSSRMSSLSGDAPIVATPAELTRELRSDDDAARNALTKGEQQAKIIVATARAEAQSIHDQAYDEGYKAGLAEAAQVTHDLIQTLERDIAEVAAERAALVDSVELDVLKLCVEAVEKLTRHEVKTDPRTVLRMIKSCLRRVKDRDEVHVRVSPQEVEQVKAHREELLGVTEGLRGLGIVEDRRVSPGGCVIETSSGNIDARIETQVQQVDRKLMETFEDGRPKTGCEPDEVQQGDQPD